MHATDKQHQVLLALRHSATQPGYSRTLTTSGHTVTTVASVQEARAALRRDQFDVAVLDCSLEAPDDGYQLAVALLAEPVHPVVIVMSDQPDVKEAVALTKAGAFDYVAKPVKTTQLLEMVRDAGARLLADTASGAEPAGFDDFLRAFLVSSVPAVQEMAALSRAVASQPDACALLIGETGAGKGILSHMIHWLSPQAKSPFVRVNLVDIDPTDLDQKLFGGPGVGEGLLAAARGGSLVLRELSELDGRVHDKFRRLLETRRYATPISSAERSFHARMLVTSSWEAERLIRDRNLDPSFVYRLASVTIRVPPLRERAGDIPRIADAIMKQVATDASRPDLRLADSAVDMIIEYPWPGNLRELRNVLTRLALLCPNDLVTASELGRALGYAAPDSSRDGRNSGLTPRIHGRRSRAPSVPVPRISGITAQSLDEPARAERERIEAALEAADGHRERAAAILGMSRTTLWTRMRMLGVDYERFHRPRQKAQ